MNTNVTISAKTQTKEETEQLWQEIQKALTDAEIDQVKVERQHSPGEGSANEPLTIAVTLTVSTVAITVGIVRIIERWLETKRQEQDLKAFIEVAQVAPEALPAFVDLAANHANVALKLPTATAKDLSKTDGQD